MSCSEDDSVYGSDGGEQQRGRQASAPEPFCMASKDTGGYENIVSGSRGELTVARSGGKNSWYRRQNGQRGTYRYREPGPYWPDTGKAQITCRAVLVAFVAVRVAKVFKRDVEESAGMTSHSSSGTLRREWLSSKDKVPSKRGRARSLGSSGAVGVCQGREGCWLIWRNRYSFLI